MIILPCPKRPDLDCIAGAVAYAEYLTKAKGQTARVWICGTPDAEAEFYLHKYPHLVFANDEDVASAKAFILVDFSVKDILPPNVSAHKVIQVIDHRNFTTPHDDFPNADVHIDMVGAAATQITEYFMHDKVELSPESAAMLHGAIVTHTLCLRSATTTERDIAAVEWLKQYVPDGAELVRGQLKKRANEIISQMPSILDTEMKLETSCLGRYGFTLLELKDAADFWAKHYKMIKDWAKSKNFPVIVDIIDPIRNESIIYVSKDDYCALLADRLSAQAKENVFLLDPAWFRKQIIPLLK
ncbi:MAG TPA: DHH family phosphoesterase [Alphaproteobacteria bacterium]